MKQPRRALLVTVLSAISAIGGALGMRAVEPRELLRPVLESAGFFEVSVTHQRTEALIKRIGDIDQEKPKHQLIAQLRALSKEGRSPFAGHEREVQLRMSRRVSDAHVGVVCRGSELRDTYLQYESRRVGLITVQVEDDDTCNQKLPDEVQLGQQTWDKLDLQGTSLGKLTMNVLLHRPVVNRADDRLPAGLDNGGKGQPAAPPID